MDFLLSFMDELSRQGKSKNTVSSYVRDIKEFIQWYEDRYDKKFNGEIIKLDTDDFRVYLLKIKKYEISSVRRKMNALVSFHKFLSALNLSKPFKIDNIVVADIDHKSIKILEDNDFNKLRRAFYAGDNKRDIAIFEVLANTGVRVSELVNIDIDDIVITERNGQNNYSFIKIREGKGGKYREVNLNPAAKKAIKDYLEIRPASISNKLFLGQRGAITRTTVFRILEKYCYIAQIENIGPHTLRHTFATRLVRNGIPLTTVQRLLGHSSVQTTTDFYVYTSRDDKQMAVDCLCDDK